MFLDGEKQCFSERCMACFGTDLEKMMRADVEYFLRKEGYAPTSVAVILEFVKRWAKTDDNNPFSITGMMYPSIGL